MSYKEFLEYLENNLEGYHTFIVKAMQYQQDKNMSRPKKNRWTDDKMKKATYDMWKASMENLYNNLKQEIKSNISSAWVAFIKEHELFETINESINELDFSNDAA